MDIITDTTQKKQVESLPAITRIKFYDDTLITVKRHGKIYVAMKPIVEALGLQWGSQYNRLQRDEVLSTCVSVMNIQISGDDQQRDVIFLPLDHFHGWLFTITVSRVRKEIQDKLIRYKKECYSVLSNHFTQSDINRKDPACLIARYEGKVSRKFDTDITAAHQIYAERQGSTETLRLRIINDTFEVYNFLYSDFKRGMEIPNNHRDLMPREVLMQCKRLEDAQAFARIEGEAKDLTYKEIKKNKKSMLNALAERYGRFSFKDICSQVAK
ncbi:MAG: phage antirepressor N-terminal domain-containing protein [Nitrospirae bacterium]|nr:phage antirepressor N-terminal domain-containing protein [Nitrospirota bacterium]